MDDKNEVFSAQQVINNIFQNIKVSDMQQENDISNVWEETIQKIYNYGPKLAGHTKIIDLKNGILLIETDHPGWNQILNNFKDFILKGLKMKIKDVEINSLAFKVRGNVKGLSESYEESKKREQQDYINKVESEQKKLEEMGFKNDSSKSEIDPEVKKLFEGILE